MQIQICGRGIHVGDRLREHIELRVRFALQRFAQRIRKVRVQLRDLNGPRGGLDKSCHLMVCLTPAATVFIEDRSPSVYAAINRVVDKAATSIVRRVKRSGGRGRAGKISRDRHPELRGRLAVASWPEGFAS